MDIALVGGSAGQSLALCSEGSRHIPGGVFDPQGRMPEATKQRFPLTSMLTSRSLESLKIVFSREDLRTKRSPRHGKGKWGGREGGPAPRTPGSLTEGHSCLGKAAVTSPLSGLPGHSALAQAQPDSECKGHGVQWRGGFDLSHAPEIRSLAEPRPCGQCHHGGLSPGNLRRGISGCPLATPCAAHLLAGAAPAGGKVGPTTCVLPGTARQKGPWSSRAPSSPLPGGQAVTRGLIPGGARTWGGGVAESHDLAARQAGVPAQPGRVPAM